MKPVESRVRDLMIAVDEYTIVHRNATLYDALSALQEAHQRTPEGVPRHRAVLVRDDYGRIVGKVGHLAFLRAVRSVAVNPFATDPGLEAAGLDVDMMRQSQDVYRLLRDDIQSLCATVGSVRVGEVMRPVTENIDAGATLLEALDAFDRLECLSLLVTDGADTVGILRLVDLFDEIARTLRDHCEPCQEGG
jgi:hypothetical protein